MTQRGTIAATIALMVALPLLATACSSPPAPKPPPGPQGNAQAFLTDWARQDWPAMRALTQSPPADFITVNAQTFKELDVAKASFAGRPPKITHGKATVAVTERLKLNGFGAMVIPTTLHLTQQHNGKWLVDWTPATIVVSTATLAAIEAWRCAL